MGHILKKFIPPDQWKIPVIIAAGIFTGLGLYSFHLSNAPSYLGDKPETCINCHIMAPQYATWSHSSYREKTNCNDCHCPEWKDQCRESERINLNLTCNMQP